MREILLTSSALILALLALRRLFRETLSRRVQYALWGLVLVRLLTPVSLPAAGFSLLTAAEPVARNMEALYAQPYQETVRGQDGAPVYGPPDTPNVAVGPATPDSTLTFSAQNSRGNPIESTVSYQRQIALEDLLRPVWYGGMAVMACWLVLSNLLFWRKLRRTRIPYSIEGSQRPVYLVESGLPSPCLFGLFRPAVYLTPAALASPGSLRHVLAHEETHARHLDPLWSLLRGVCLVVYWFDPLVWWAALASRTDCELACDEGALRRLGEAERVPYGRTLLSLVPVRSLPANPLLSATTMTADKRRLTDRITRIAENRKNLGTALFAVIALAALVCAVTFTGAKTETRYASADEAVSAVAEELSGWGSDDITERLVVYTPEDPPQFFELDEGEVLRVYRSMIAGLSSNLSDPMGWLCSLYRVDKAEALTAKVDIDKQILWEAAAGDEEHIYLLSRPAQAPEMKQGQTQGALLTDRVMKKIREALLASEGAGPVTGWAYPDWEPLLTISLDGLEPYEPNVVELTLSSHGDFHMLSNAEDPDRVLGDYCLLFFGDEHGVFAGVQHILSSSFPQPFWAFLPGAEGTYSASFFRNLMGHDGFCITHSNAGRTDGTPLNDYYYLNEDGQPICLARGIQGWPGLIDLDGDGEKELLSQSFGEYAIYFRRDGKYYRADLNALLNEHWPKQGEGELWPYIARFYFETWDAASRSLSFRADLSHSSAEYIPARFSQYRTLYFDGESLLVYNDQRHFEDHIIEGFDIDPRIVSAGKEAVQLAFEAAGEPYDDWRITDFDLEETLDIDGQTYHIWKVTYEFHTPEPREDLTLGGQDCWIDPCYPETTYLVFRCSEAEYGLDRTYLFSIQQYLRPTDGQLIGRLALTENLPNAAALQAQAALDEITAEDTVNMTLLVPEGGGRYDVDPQAGNGRNRANYFTFSYDWSYAEDPGDMPASSLLVMSPGGNPSFRFWPDSDLVLLSQREQQTWFRAVPNGDTDDVFRADIFSFMRSWYDEAEHAGLVKDIAIPGRGQSREEIVQAWTDAYEGAMLRATPGSKYACTFVRNEDIGFPDWLDELSEEELNNFYPAYTAGHERFAFSCRTVFVPENQAAEHWLMAGNTGEYEGGGAPEGAMVYTRCGYMYLTGDGWRCDGTGTGW